MMKRAVTWMIGLGLVLQIAAGLALADDDLAAMAAGVKDYRTKFHLIAKGRDAVRPLMRQVTSEDAWLAFESKSALRWIALHARRQGGEAEAIAREVEWYCDVTHAMPPEVVAFGAELLGDLGSPQSAAVLSDCIHRDKVASLAAIDALRRLPGDAARRYLEDGLKAGRTWQRAALLRAIGARGDSESLPILLESAQAGEATAIEALGDGGYAGAEKVLVEFCRKQNPGAFSALLKIAAAQADTAMLARLYGHAQDDAERLQVIQAGAGRCVKEGALVEMLGHAMERPALKAAAQDALLSACGCFRRQTMALLGRRVLRDAANAAIRQRALAVLGRSGDESAAEDVIPHLAADKSSVRTTAIVALGEIPGRKAIKALIETFRDTSDPAIQSLLIRTFRARQATEAVDLLSAWMPSAPHALREQAGEALLHIADAGGEEAAAPIHLQLLRMGVKEPALRGLARSGGFTAVPTIVGAIADADLAVRRAGVDALVAIGRRAAADGDREAAIATFRAALDAGALVENELRKLGESVEITAREGRISSWWIRGPFPAPTQEAWKTEAPLEVDLAAVSRSEGSEPAWLPVQVGGADAIVDLDGLLTPNEQVTAWAYAEVYVRKERDVVLKTGSDDGLIVWVNGKRVIEKLVLRGISVDEDSATIHLKEGKNTFVLKICEAGGGWGFCARLEDTKGRPLKFKIR